MMAESALPNALPPDPAGPMLGTAEELPVGTRLAEFEIKGVLGRGGFGIVYLALDESLQRQVAIKEYLPAAFARRCPDGGLAVRNAVFAETFEMGLRSFVNESRLLARFDHPALVKVHRFWEANGTAYMVMPYYQGVTLTRVRLSMTVPPSEAWLRRILTALLGALDVMHTSSVFHRDVAPDNIVLLPSGLPVLLDFGAARHVLEDQAQAITALVKPAYAPIEQYAAGSEFHQGPWTDIYGVAATLHYGLTGNPPPTAAARIVDDDYERLSRSGALLAPATGEPYDRDWLAALDWGLEVRPQDRPQSIAQWQKALGISPAPARLARDRPSIDQALPPQAPTPAAVDAFARTIADRPRRALPSFIAVAASAPKSLRWAATGLALASLLAIAWQATTSTPPASLAAQVSDSPATARSESRPSIATAPLAAVVAVAPRAMQAVHAPSAADDVATEKVTSMPTPTSVSAPAPPAPRKMKLVKAKMPARGGASRGAEVAAGGPQVVEARREPAWVHANGQTPRDVCKGRSFFGALSCMRETCNSAKWAQHSQCRTWRDMEQRHLAARP